MTGSPLIRLALLALALFLIAIPAWRLTAHRAPTAAALAPATNLIRKDTLATLTFTSPVPPDEIIVHALGKTVATVRAERSSAETTFPVSLPPAGLDLVINAKWRTSATANALRIEAVVEGGPRSEATFWGGTEIQDVFFLPGLAAP